MKKIISAILSAVLLTAFAGCSQSTDSAQTEVPSEASASQSTVSTDGSTSMEKVIGYLSESYMEENKNVKVTYNPTGSGAGIQAVSDGRCDIGLSSRDLKDDEKTTLDQTVVAIDGIAIVVNPSNTASNLSVQQLADIYTGEITNWSQAEMICL